MADIKTKYPSTSSVAITISLASLASGAAGVFTAGQESTAIDNTVNLDVDHLVSGKIRVGAGSVTANRSINVYAYAPVSISSGTPTYPDVLDGSDSAETFTSSNVMNSAMQWVATMTVDATSSRDYFFAPVSIASLFGGQLPPFWGLFVAHDTGTGLSTTGGDHIIHYTRVQAQTV